MIQAKDLKKGEKEMDFYRVFDSGYLYGIGRMAAVAAAFERMGLYYLEIYAFSVCHGNAFKGRTIIYHFNPSEIIEEEMELNAVNVINDILHDQYEKDKNEKLLNQYPKPVEIKRSILLSLKAHQFHVDTLEGISKNSGCKSLKEYLKQILSLPSITINDHNPLSK